MSDSTATERPQLPRPARRSTGVDPRSPTSAPASSPPHHVTVGSNVSLSFLYLCFYCLKWWFLSERPSPVCLIWGCCHRGSRRTRPWRVGTLRKTECQEWPGSGSLGPAFGGMEAHLVQIRGSVERALGVRSQTVFSTTL